MTQIIKKQRLAVYLKSSQTIIVDFNVDDTVKLGELNPQIQLLKDHLAEPGSQHKVLMFEGHRIIGIRVSEIAAYEVIAFTVSPKEENDSDAVAASQPKTDAEGLENRTKQ